MSESRLGKVLSVNVGLPREVTWMGKRVTTGIFKAPAQGPVALRRHDLKADRQAELAVRGGPPKAVCVYPSQHYNYWRGALGDKDISWGSGR